MQKSLSSKEERLVENMTGIFYEIMAQFTRVPCRTELYKYLSEADLEMFIKNKKISPFNNYLYFLQREGLLTPDEQAFLKSDAAGFIEMIEHTAMSKSYKMPLLLAFYHPEKVNESVTDKMVYESFYHYYRTGENKVDMLKDNSSKLFENWTQNEYIQLARKNPIHFMLQSHGEWFCIKDGSELALQDRLLPWLDNSVFIRQLKDVIDYRSMDYFYRKFHIR